MNDTFFVCLCWVLDYNFLEPPGFFKPVVSKICFYVLPDFFGGDDPILTFCGHFSMQPPRVGAACDAPAEVKFLETVPLLANQLPRADLPTLAAALVEKRSMGRWGRW